MAQRPRRKGKGDRLLYSGAARTDIECDYAVAAMDRLALDMDLKWGVDCLPGFVSTETAAKYGSAIAKLNAAIEASDPQETAVRAEVCRRGLLAMDAEATALGRNPASGDFLEFHLGDFAIGILKEGREWQTAQQQRPDLMFFTLREVAVAMRERCATAPVAMTKALFPGAEITGLNKAPQSDLAKMLDDEIKF